MHSSSLLPVPHSLTRQPYVELSDADRARYDAERLEFLQKRARAGLTPVRLAKGAKEKPRRRRFGGELPKAADLKLQPPHEIINPMGPPALYHPSTVYTSEQLTMIAREDHLRSLHALHKWESEIGAPHANLVNVFDEAASFDYVPLSAEERAQPQLFEVFRSLLPSEYALHEQDMQRLTAVERAQLPAPNLLEPGSSIVSKEKFLENWQVCDVVEWWWSGRADVDGVLCRNVPEMNERWRTGGVLRRNDWWKRATDK
jgi:hypothetical protein